MNMKKPAFVFTVLIGGFLAGCGQTGPLYLPDEPPPIHVEPETETESETEQNAE